MEPYYLLIRIHDHIWRDKYWPFRTRVEASQLIWDLTWKLIDEQAAVESRPE